MCNMYSVKRIDYTSLSRLGLFGVQLFGDVVLVFPGKRHVSVIHLSVE